MENQKLPACVRLLVALFMGLAIAVITLKASVIIQISEPRPPWMSGFITHTFMWILSVLIALILTKGELK
ncbi:MAG: hypothetical protein KAT75_10890, partial [Dehalococcoidia bacterium]|nr:hypothetical protein [Dehalococcoidia bacterium]